MRTCAICGDPVTTADVEGRPAWIHVRENYTQVWDHPVASYPGFPPLSPEVRLASLHRQLAAVVEELGEKAYQGEVTDALRNLAIREHLDHTYDPLAIVHSIEAELSRRAEVVARLVQETQSLTKRLRETTTPTIQPDPQPVPGGESIAVDTEWFMWAMKKLGGQ